MPGSIYTELPTADFTIRLLKLQPSPDRSSPIRCSLIRYPLAIRPCGSHLFEALSYEWGSEDDQQTIYVNAGSAPFQRVQATRNLHAALIHLRDPLFERVLWIDAVCINQQDDNEKGHQVALMARIFGLAQRVVVWLGEEGEGSAIAFDEFNSSRVGTGVLENDDQNNTIDENRATDSALGDEPQASANDRITRRQAVMSLFNRSYFRRIWVQQELAASRNLLFMCGESECQGETFRESMNRQRFDEETILEAHLRTLKWLLKASSGCSNVKGQVHLMLKPLGELINMFYTHHASDKRDKIFALYGMCSDACSAHLLEPDYSLGWEELFSRFGRFTFGDSATVAAHSDREIQLIRTSGFVLGRIGKIKSTEFWSDTQNIQIVSFDSRRYLDDKDSWTVNCDIERSGRAVRIGDLVLLTEERRKVVIVRPRPLVFRIVLVTGSDSVRIREPGINWNPPCLWSPFLKRITTDPTPFNLIWNWEEEGSWTEHVEFGLIKESVLIRTHRNRYEMGNRIPVVYALSDMSFLYESCAEYEQSAKCLRNAMDLGLGEDANKDLEALNVSSRLVILDEKSAKASRVAMLIAKWYDRLRFENYHTYVGHFSGWLASSIVREILGQPHLENYTELDWNRLAVKLLSGVDVTSAILDKAASVSDYYTRINRNTSTFFTVLEELADDSVECSQEILETLASRDVIDISNMLLACKRIPGSITNLPAILRNMRNGHDSSNLSLYLTQILKELGDRLVITGNAIDAIMEVTRTPGRVIEVLLGAAKDDIEISQNALRLAAGCENEDSGVIRRLLEVNPCCHISEPVLIQAAQNQYFGLEVLKVLFEFARPRLLINEAVVQAMVANPWQSSQLFRFVLGNYDPQLKISVRSIIGAAPIWKHDEPRSIIKLFLLHAEADAIQELSTSSEALVRFTVAGDIDFLENIHALEAIPNYCNFRNVAYYRRIAHLHAGTRINDTMSTEGMKTLSRIRIVAILEDLRADAMFISTSDIRHLCNQVLMSAISLDRFDDVEGLLESDLSDVNFRDPQNITPLALAVRWASQSVVQLILNHGGGKDWCVVGDGRRPMPIEDFKNRLSEGHKLYDRIKEACEEVINEKDGGACSEAAQAILQTLLFDDDAETPPLLMDPSM